MFRQFPHTGESASANAPQRQLPTAPRARRQLHRRRRGVVLLVILAKIIILTIVVLSFTLYAETCHPALASLRESAWQVARDSVSLERSIEFEYRHLTGDVDVRPVQQAIDELNDHVATLKARIRAAWEAERDPQIRETLESLDGKTDDLVSQLELLSGLIETLVSE